MLTLCMCVHVLYQCWYMYAVVMNLHGEQLLRVFVIKYRSTVRMYHSTQATWTQLKSIVHNYIFGK